MIEQLLWMTLQTLQIFVLNKSANSESNSEAIGQK